ncbi:MAG TPA: penicillin-binding protein 2 [Thermohalobaculum sp.]|nr:penicillin-binding protein 2 [Thermohalobaculum sp.]
MPWRKQKIRDFGFGAPKPGEVRNAPKLTRRGFVLLGVQLAVAGGLAWRMRQLQLVEHDTYHLLAEENRINLRLIAPARGEIFDRHGAPLALNSQNYRVVMVREQAKEPEEMLNRLGYIIDLPGHQRDKALKEMASKSSFVPVPVAEHLSWREFAAVNANAPALPGVQPEVGMSRFYPNGHGTCHVVGYVGRVSERDIETEEQERGAVDPLLTLPEFQMGKTGVERARELELRGTAGNRRIEVNAGGRVVRELGRTEGEPGADLQLTLDLDLQQYALDRLNGESAAVVVMDVRTGDLLALASYPTFDPNLFVTGISYKDYAAYREDKYRPLHNKWANGLYPPGSTFKMMVAMTGLHHGIIKPGASVFCNGGYNLGNRRFHCWKKGGHGHVAMLQSLAQSCDVYYYDLAKRCGIDNIAAMCNRFGLGVDHEVDFPSLKAGLIPTQEWKKRVKDDGWRQGDTLNSGIGQGFVLTSPFELALMTARLASGKALRPRLVRARGGVPLPVEEPPALDIDPEHLGIVQRGMFEVVQGGTAYRSRIADPANQMAGKTGTSQVRNITRAERARGVTRNDQLPWERRDHALFICYAPFEAPKYAVSVIVEHGGGGSATAAPIARDVMVRALYGPNPPASAFPGGEIPETFSPLAQPSTETGRVRT